MNISLIVAMAENGVIGNAKSLPWHLSSDMKRFKGLTQNHDVIMGRKTYESIGHPLSDRSNIIITHSEDYVVEGASVVHSFDEALTLLPPAQEVFVIGGAEIFKQAEPLASKIYLTLVHASPEGDSFFSYNQDDWRVADKQEFKADVHNDYDFDFITLERKSGEG